MSETAQFPGAITTQLHQVEARTTTYLTNDIDSTQVTIAADTTGFPVKGFITIESETSEYTSLTALQFNIGTRGYAGTKVSHIAGKAIKLSVAAATMNRVIAEVVAIETVLGANISGWTPAGTFTYNTSNSITVASGAALIYQKSDKIKFTQHGAVKKMYVTSVTDTYLGVTAGSDFTVEDTATYPITLPYYSHIENPLGFPNTFNFTTVPTTTANAYTNVPTINLAQFSIRNNMVTFRIEWTFNATSGGTGSCLFTTPVTVSPTTHGTIFGSQISSGWTLFGASYGANAVMAAKYDGATCIVNSAKCALMAILTF